MLRFYSASGSLAPRERYERGVRRRGTPGSSFRGSFQDLREEKRMSGAYNRTRDWRCMWIYASALRPVPETFSRAWPSSSRLGRYSRCHSGHKAAPTREDFFLFNFQRGKQCWAPPTSSAPLCLVSPPLSEQRRNELWPQDWGCL